MTADPRFGGPEPTDAEVDARFAELVARLREQGSSSDDLARPGEVTEPYALGWPGRGPEDRLPQKDFPAPDFPTPECPSREQPPASARPASRSVPLPSSDWRRHVPEAEDEVYERYRPELVPIGRPHWPFLVGWIAMTLAVVATLVVIFGVELPRWVGWLAVGLFLGGFGLLVAQLPRHRDPDAGDGAVL